MALAVGDRIKLPRHAMLYVATGWNLLPGALPLAPLRSLVALDAAGKAEVVSTHFGVTRTGTTDHAAMLSDDDVLLDLPSATKTAALFVTVHAPAGARLDTVEDAWLLVADHDGKEVCRHRVPARFGYRTITLGRIYLHKGTWRLQALAAATHAANPVELLPILRTL